MQEYDADSAIPLSSTTIPRPLPVDAHQARTYLRCLFGRATSGWVVANYRDRDGQFKSMWAPTGENSLEELVERIVAIAKEGRDIWCAVGLRARPLKSGRGTEQDVVALASLALDIDFGAVGHRKGQLPPDEAAAWRLLEAVVERLGGARPTLVVHSGHGLQPHWVLTEPWSVASVEEAKTLTAALNRLLQQVADEMGWETDSVGDLARILRVPGTWNHKPGCEPVPVRLVELDESRRYTVEDLRSRLMAWVAVDAYRRRLEAVDFPEDLPRVEVGALRVSQRMKRVIVDGPGSEYPSRSEAVYAVVCAMAEAGHTPAEILAVLMDERYAISERPRQKGRAHTEGEIERILAKVLVPEVDGPESSEEPPEGGSGDGQGAGRPQHYEPTDLGNAYRLRDAYQQDIRYAADTGFLVWDGKRWVRDSDETMVRRLAQLTVEGIYQEAARVHDPDGRKELLRWARTSQNTMRISAMLKEARALPELRIASQMLDTAPYLLNCLNGTVDLRTGKLLPHRRDDFITMLVPVEYDPAAKAPMWEAFIEHVAGGDPELKAFLQVLAGYGLTGEIFDRLAFFLIHGPSGTGKSTYVEVLRDVIGPDYAAAAPFETFLATKGERIRNDLARLRSKRFVGSGELPKDAKVAEHIVKALTGSDTIVARYLYKEYFEFRATFKIIISTNYEPHIDAGDDAAWERAAIIPFNNQVPKDRRVREFQKRLVAAEAPGILAWAIEGAKRFYEDGLTLPKAVIEKTQQVRKDMDPLGLFLEEECVKAPGARVEAQELFDRYVEYLVSKLRVQHTPSRMTFGKAMSAKGYKGDWSHGKCYYHGLKLLPRSI